MKRWITSLVVTVVLLSGCNMDKSGSGETLAQARQNFQTVIVNQQTDDYTADVPPESIFELIQFTSPVGELDAYITPDPGDNQRHPAIIWIVGGWSNSISSTSWGIAPADNDQSARAFREAGIVTMYPSRRGGNENQSSMESWYGELDDIMSAYDYLSKLNYVDPNRIYIGGHSTGGSQAILMAEYSDKFRAAFSFGPKGSVNDSDSSYFTFDSKNKQEILLRSPISWVSSITTPTYIFEGEAGNANFVTQYITEAKKASKSSLISGYIIKGGDHFDILAPLTPLVAQKILADTGQAVNISFSEEELDENMKSPRIATRNFRNAGGTYQLSLSGDWVNEETEMPEDLSILSMDECFYVSVESYPTDLFRDIDELLEAMKSDVYGEDTDAFSEVKDVVIKDVNAAKQFTWTMEVGNDIIVFGFTIIQTDNAFYVISINAYEEDYMYMEKELAVIPFTFEEI